VPLPSKWSTRFLEPVPLDERYGPEAADDPEVVAGVCDEIEGRMQAAIDQLLAKRRSIWWGSRFGEE